MNLLYVYLFCIGLVVEALILFSNEERKIVKVLLADNGGSWGEWHPPRFCAEGAYATGYTMKIEDDQHGHDDTSLNAILLRCRFLHKGSDAGVIESGEGPWGVWLQWTECSHGINQTFSFLTSFNLQVEPYQGGGDDTAANYVKFKCRNLTDNTGSSEHELALENGKGLFGSYGSWSESCPWNTAICGMRVKIEDDQHGRDDTALNDVQFYCCE
ncbi:hypothetical protein CHS0354_036543 [Potamilus streckersoni]|uniref:Vitelline membrane outer layer protein 1 homolog n=1 Tax=Potamilus streckersoni TaxID=2493646 RepID=A0AAE0TAP7_9BIVA|nr:hypothetical protein CHS0354_036543 [Potamilus streckersoni]